MRLPVGFLLRIAKGTQPPDEEYRQMYIIIRKPYAHLEEELLKTFEGQKDVKVIVDRRSGERQMSINPVVKGRQRADQRGTKEQLVEVVISV